MHIVVLDGYALNPGDLSWDGLKALGRVTVYDRSTKEEALERVKDAEILLTNKTPITEELLAAARKVKYVGVMATGYNIVDLEACRRRNIPVTNVPAYSTNAVAQLVFAYLLEICHHVTHHTEAVMAGEWTNSKDFSFWNYPLIELSGKTMGVIGFGSIGIRVSEIAQAFGMKVLVWSRTKKPEYENERLIFVPLDELYRKADVISVHVPLTKETENLIDKEAINKMKDGVILINTARGGIINEKDLADALNSGKVYAAGVDVVTKEPIEADNPLLKAKNLFITPHIGWAPKEARTRCMEIVVQNVKAFIEGKPQNVVNGVKESEE